MHNSKVSLNEFIKQNFIMKTDSPRKRIKKINAINIRENSDSLRSKSVDVNTKKNLSPFNSQNNSISNEYNNEK